MVDASFRLVDKLENENILSQNEFVELFQSRTEEVSEYLFKKAVDIRDRYYGRDIYIRGLIEISNYCRNNCFYCGIRADNRNILRYRLYKDDIITCCKKGYEMGFRTFVMQGGEDVYYTDERMVDIVSSIKNLYPDCAVTLSLGERSRESYEALFKAGADRYLLRHETADAVHYGKLHPAGMSLANRKECLFNLKKIGYQTGTGFMVGSPFQTCRNIAEDLAFMYELQPEMVGIGPFVPHHDTPFAHEKGGTSEFTVFLLGVIRLMLPKVLLPATTALGTIDDMGREKGVMAGANVIMPNLSPVNVRDKYMIYDNKISTGSEAAETLFLLKQRMEKIGCHVVVSRGDHADVNRTGV